MTQTQRIADLKRQLAEAKKDTARLDWIESKGEVIGKAPFVYGTPSWYTKTRYPLHRQGRYLTLRAAIDAAREGK